MDAGSVLIGGTYFLHDDLTGETLEVPVSVDLAAAIRDLDAAMARRTKKAARREVQASSIEGKTGVPFDPPDTRGPHYDFRWFVGECTVWEGPTPEDRPCPCCAGLVLSTIAYCLKCDRSGRDDLLKRPPVAARPALEAGKFKARVKAKGKAKGKAKPARNSFDLSRLRNVR